MKENLQDYLFRRRLAVPGTSGNASRTLYYRNSLQSKNKDRVTHTASRTLNILRDPVIKIV
jgi:hypothetical protein